MAIYKKIIIEMTSVTCIRFEWNLTLFNSSNLSNFCFIIFGSHDNSARIWNVAAAAESIRILSPMYLRHPNICSLCVPSTCQCGKNLKHVYNGYFLIPIIFLN